MKLNLFIVAIFFVLNRASGGANPLQEIINSVQESAVVKIKPGVYKGNLEINKSISLIAEGDVIIDGGFEGTVVRIVADKATFQGFKVINSGDNHTQSDACVEVSGNQNQLISNKIENCFFGIKVKDSIKGLFKDNEISSYKDKDVSDRGDGFFVWNSHNNEFVNNHITFVRDFSLNNSSDNLLYNNQIEHSRTGAYLVFAKGTVINENRFNFNSTGIAALYSPDVLIKKNIIKHSLSGNASCVSSKESVGGRLVENQFINCGVGYLSDAPKGEDTIHIYQNLFAHNFLAIRIYGQKGSHDFVENVFFENLDNLVLPLDGEYHHIRWERNYWDNYHGFGKEPYLDVIFSDRIWMEIPKAKFFSNSPFFEFIDFLERLAPFSSPTIQAEDKSPQNKTSEVFKRYEKVIYK